MQRSQVFTICLLIVYANIVELTVRHTVLIIPFRHEHMKSWARLQSMFSRYYGMLQSHIKYVNIWTISVNNSQYVVLRQISIRWVQVKLTCSKPSSEMLFCPSFLFLLCSKYTNNCKIGETCSLGDMYSYRANSSGVVGNHGSSNIYVTKIR